MTTTDKITQRKRTLLEFAEELGNVSKACKICGYSQQQFYEIAGTTRPTGRKDSWTAYIRSQRFSPQPGILGGGRHHSETLPGSSHP